MTYKMYKTILPGFYFLFLLVFSAAIYIHSTEQPNVTFLTIVCFYAAPILSLFFLYFGIYALVSRVKPMKIFGGATTCIMYASVFILLSFGYPILNYLYFARQPIHSISSRALRQLKERSRDPIKNSFGKYEAQLYYMETGQKVKYVNENGSALLYSPSKSDEDYLEQRKQLLSIANSFRKSFITLSIFTGASLIAFLLFLRSRGSMAKRGNIP